MRLACLLIVFSFLAPALHAEMNPAKESALDRFLRYAKIDTQSEEDRPSTPSTRKQFNLANLLVKELKALGLKNAHVSQYCIVYAMLPGNLPDNSRVPTIGFISHMDTSSAVSGANVNPVIHKNYQGGDIVLPKDPSQVITVEKNPVLKEMIGDDIITADGTTLLGSDDKSGVAEIMTMLDTLVHNPQVKHGNIAVAFTPDEEVGTGVDKFDIKEFGAKLAYTVDGKTLGKITNETWNARSARVTFQGKSTHPGDAKGVMINSLYAIADFILRVPPDMRSETTEGRVGFVHPYAGELMVESSTLKLLLRDFDRTGLDAKVEVLKQMVADTQQKFPDVKITLDVRDEYNNMIEVLKNYPELTENAMEAARRAGLKPMLSAERGGTDGADLTFRGLPCPDIFTGGHNFHGKLEFNSVGGLNKTVETLVNLVRIYAEK